MLYIKTQNNDKIFVEGFTKIKTAKKRLSQRDLEGMKFINGQLMLPKWFILTKW